MTGISAPEPGPASPQHAGARAIELRLPSVVGLERVAMEAAAAAARLAGLPEDRVEDVKTAVSEATLNAMEHGNDFDPRCSVIVELLPRSDGLEISIRDEGGKAYGLPVNAAPPTLPERVSGALEPRGWGLFLISSLMDQVDVVPTRHGRVLRMVALRQV